MPKVYNRRERFLKAEEADILFAKLSKTSKTLHDISLTGLHTGMRASEIFRLKWGHIDLDNKLILVADSKPGPSRNAYMTEALENMLRNRELGEREENVFKSTNGKEITEISNSFVKVVNKLGFNNGITDARQKVTFHTLRHTFASWLALKGESLLTIKELLGHQTLAMTERYSHLMPDQKREAVKSVESVFRGVNGLKPDHPDIPEVECLQQMTIDS